MEFVNIQVGSSRVRNALLKMNRPTRLQTIKLLFPELSNETCHKICDNLNVVTTVSGSQIRVPTEFII